MERYALRSKLSDTERSCEYPPHLPNGNFLTISYLQQCGSPCHLLPVRASNSVTGPLVNVDYILEEHIPTRHDTLLSTLQRDICVVFWSHKFMDRRW